jgi:hypothetical protein
MGITSCKIGPDVRAIGSLTTFERCATAIEQLPREGQATRQADQGPHEETVPARPRSPAIRPVSLPLRRRALVKTLSGMSWVATAFTSDRLEPAL